MFITVLPPDKNSDPWIAVQFNNDLAALKANTFFEAGVSKTFIRDPGDSIVPETKTITEKTTGDTVQHAVIVHLATIFPDVALHAVRLESKSTAGKKPRQGKPKPAAKEPQQ